MFQRKDSTVVKELIFICESVIWKLFKKQLMIWLIIFILEGNEQSRNKSGLFEANSSG